jgi:pimeloyl-ACP methyl ester carboxylesterase
MKRLWLLGVPILALVGAAAIILPQLQPELPNPTGPNLVGYHRVSIGDEQRWVDTQIFYPAKEKTENQPQAIPADLATQFAKAYNTPEFAMIDERPLPAFTDAKAKEGEHPTLIFNHGHGMYGTQNSHQIIELASHGYVVITLNHPGHSLLSKRANESATRAAGVAEYEDDEVVRLLKRQATGNDELRAATNLNDWVFSMKALEEDAFADIVDQFPEWIKNNDMVLNELQNIQSGDTPTPLKSSLDLTKIGFFGHSFGGAVATHMGMNDRRVKAAYNMDGPVFTWSLNPHPKAQFCFAYNDSNEQAGVKSSSAWMNQQLAIALNGCERTFNSASHMNFSDLNEIKFLKWLGQLGPIDNKLMRESLNQSLLQFFNQHLLGIGESTNLEGTELIQH